MSDQPPTDHSDHMPDEADRPPTTPAMVPLKEAAVILGISVNAVRQRLKRGTLEGVKTSAGWLVDPTPTTDQPLPDQGNQPPTTRVTVVATTDQPPTDHVDLSPLVTLVDDLRRENAQLHSVSSWLMSQNITLQQEVERLRTIEALTPGDVPSEAVESSERDDTPVPGSGHGHDAETTPTGALSRLWQWLRGR